MTLPMIETLIYVLSGILAGGSIAAYWTYVSGKKVITAKTQFSETQIKAAEQRALVLKDQLEIAQADRALLKEKLDKERHSKVLEMGELRQNLQRGALLFAGYALSLGIVFGGTVSWICTGARAEARHYQRVMDIEVESRVAKAQQQMLTEELTRARSENQDLRDHLQSEFEHKAVAYAKLEALMSSLDGDKHFQGFIADQKKLIRELSRYTPEDRFETSAKTPAALSVGR